MSEILKNLDDVTASDLELIENAWLKIDVPDDYIRNPIKDIPEAFSQEPHIFLTYMLSRPEYFAAFCKYVLNITILPYQSIILQQTWKHKFPMIVASRGASKSFLMGIYALLRTLFLPGHKVVTAGSAFRQSKIIFEYMEKIYHESPLLKDLIKGEGKSGIVKGNDRWTFDINGGSVTAIPVGCCTEDTLVTTDQGIKRIKDLRFENSYKRVWSNGRYRETGFFFDNGIWSTIEITTRAGYRFACTPNHKIKILSPGSEIVWKRFDELVIEDLALIDCFNRPYGNKSEDRKEILGLIDSGYIIGKNIVIAHRDPQLIQYKLSHFGIFSNVRNGLVRFPVKQVKYDAGKAVDLIEDVGSITSDPIVKIEKLVEQPTYDINIPDGNEYCANGFFSHNTGEKIRGIRAGTLQIDEAKSISPQIMEEVMSGFLAVSENPVTNVIEEESRRKAIELGYQPVENTDMVGNQMIMTGTAYYAHNHFCKYWQKYCDIIRTEGKLEKLREVYSDQEIPEAVDYRDYCVIRLPYELLPAKFMDEAQVARTKASIDSGIYANEYGAVFSTDSNGFFKRSLIESCVVGAHNTIHGDDEVYFEPEIYGDKSCEYIMGIDPASEYDNFSIVIIKLVKKRRHVVYCWTTTRKNHRDKLKRGIVKEHDFYSYVNRKVRDLMDRFNIIRIVLDSQGGGIAVLEAFRNKGNMIEGEVPILEIRDPSKKKASDREEGLHIVEIAVFSNAAWLSSANHGLKKDMEDQRILFPAFDAMSLSLAVEEDAMSERLYDNMADCIEEIEELKEEICAIVVELTPSGRERFLTPEEIVGNKKKRQKKDRYCSLVMANMAARIMQDDEKVRPGMHMGDFADNVKSGKGGALYYGNPAYNKAAINAYRDL